MAIRFFVISLSAYNVNVFIHFVSLITSLQLNYRFWRSTYGALIGKDAKNKNTNCLLTSVLRFFLCRVGPRPLIKRNSTVVCLFLSTVSLMRLVESDKSIRRRYTDVLTTNTKPTLYSSVCIRVGSLLMLLFNHFHFILFGVNEVTVRLYVRLGLFMLGDSISLEQH